MLIKPIRLNAGDTVGIVSPASAPEDRGAIDRCVEAVERLGFRAQLGRNAQSRLGFLAGTDRERASDLMRMFKDRRVKGIFCVRGGYGTARLLPLLDYRAVQANPKVFMGYSDITSLHCAFLRKANLVTFHGPMLNSDFIKADVPKFTVESFLCTATSASPPGSIGTGYRRKTVEVLRRGVAEGRLIGGNLTLLCAALGTPYLPFFKGCILFFEDLDEMPYRFDRLLTQLLNAGVLQQVAGVAIGINKNCVDPKARRAKEYRQTLMDVFKERLLPLKVPVVAGLPFGHVPHNATIPVGVKARLDGNHGDLEIIEAAVA